MSNLRQEILKLTVNQLETRVSNIMLEINILLSKPENVSELVVKISDLITELSIAEGALNHAKTFHSQTINEALAQQMSILNQLAKQNKEEEPK